ncbi:copper chaperone PCu(A)C [Agromyces sp. ZXT2-6]|uniref:copper chaperone PCu(A)C n=1 Tax=Agromyces sp. ZXT2-6 TaxID=3461153 RepID=UPI0040552BA2
MHTRTALRLGALFAATALALTGCATASGTAGDAGTSTAAASVTVTDPWVKAAEEGMTGAFGELANGGDADVTVVSATTDAADRLELHETVEEDGRMVMREIDGGFVIPAGGTLDLEPGGSHLMLMGLTGPLAPGSEITVTLTFDDDSTVEFDAAVKDFAGADDSYHEDDDDMGDEMHDMDDDMEER